MVKEHAMLATHRLCGHALHLDRFTASAIASASVVLLAVGVGLNVPRAHQPRIGLWAPAGTAPAVIAKLNAAIVAALADSNIRKRYIELGQEIPPPAQQSPEALHDFHKAEVEKWWPIIKAAGITGQ
jgi:hypothetical protein